jgi:hypothetical protein
VKLTIGRRGLALVAIGIALLTAGGVAYATIPDGNNVYTACMLKSTGTIRLIDSSLPASTLLSHCTQLEKPISWNQQGIQGNPGDKGDKGDKGATGPDGVAGTSVTSAAEPNGANCANGGSKFTSASGDTYACDGADGTNGTNGTNGTDGTNGTNGVSVTSFAEPTGANCANGGSRFVAANGTTYACNGANGAGGGDATTLDGHDSSDFKVRCGSGFVFSGGMCWENFDNCCFTLALAAARCTSLKGRLPTYAEFLGLSQSGITLGNTLLLDWAGDSTGNDTSIYIAAVNSENMDGERPNSTASWTRCVVPPVNALGTP